MCSAVSNFIADETGAISVDWVVLSAAAVGMSLAATDVVRDGLRDVSSNLEAQLRTQQISDAFVGFTSNHFDALYDEGLITEEQAETLFTAANELTNADVLTILENGIEKMVNETITEQEMRELWAVASVAYQRNIIDDSVIEYYFSDASGNYGNGGQTETM